MTCIEFKKQNPAFEQPSVIKQGLSDQDPQLLQQQRLDAVGSLASGIAHEFNNLLQVIRAYTLFAVESLPTDSQSYNDLQKVLRASERATTLTRQLLDFSRSKVAHPKRDEIDPIVQELTNMLAPLLPAGIELHLQLAAPQVEVFVDFQHLHQALLNLCINARDAMPAGGRLTIGSQIISHGQQQTKLNLTLPPGEYVCLSITDTGTGISPDVQTHMFEPFYTTKEVHKGTGLGLSIAMGVVEQAGGYIDCDSQINRGTSFHIYLPIS